MVSDKGTDEDGKRENQDKEVEKKIKYIGRWNVEKDNGKTGVRKGQEKEEDEER